MSSKSIKKKYVITPYYGSFEEEFINLKNIIIPFSEFGENKKPSDESDEINKIPFNDRHPLFKKILLDEFIE